MSTGRNASCPCGSGKKYKQCCMRGAPSIAAHTPAATHALMQQALAHFQADRLPRAYVIVDNLTRTTPGDAEVWHLMGLITDRRGDHVNAVAQLRRAISLAPTAYMYCHLAAALTSLRQMDEAAIAYRQALALQPGFLQIHTLLGQLLESAGRLEEALENYRLAQDHHPENASLPARQGFVLEMLNRPAAAAACYRHALTLSPERADLLNNLGLVEQALGNIDAALTAFRAALRLQPDNAVIRSNLLLNLQYRTDISPEALFQEHLAYGERVGDARRSGRSDPAVRTAAPSGRLRLGYVSADLHNHSMAYFIEPVLARHDRAGFEIFCYYNFPAEDSVTQRMKAHADSWISCYGMTDARLAERIARDRIDILIDLSGHTAGNRLPVFALRPAPLQVTWLGYPGTTGLAAMDYRLTDEALDPAGMTEDQHTETLWRLPLCATFEPFADSPPINPLPALAGSPLTLACLNACFKITPFVIRLWARILDALPNARLMIGNATEEDTRQMLLARFSENGIDMKRLLLQPRLPMRDFLALHHEIDLALDPFPYGGGTTTNHALWMGVPVITLAGRTPAARHGAHNLTAAGLQEFIADTPEQYVSCVLALARDLPRLAGIRASLRERMQSRPQRSAEQLTRNLEVAYRQMWNLRKAS